MNPLISVCVPTYNDVKKLKRCIDSVLAQTITDFEIIISDDSSNDEIEQLLLTLPYKHDARIKYFKNKIALGSPANWNNSIEKATGFFIKILHHDDWLAKNTTLEKFMNAANSYRNEPVFIFSSYEDIGNNVYPKKKAGLVFKKMKKENSLLLFYNFIGAPSTCLFRKQDFIPFDCQTKWYVDVIFYKTFIEKYSCKIIYLQEVLVRIGLSENQATQVISNRVKFAEAIYTFEKYITLQDSSNLFLIRIKLLELISRYQIELNYTYPDKISKLRIVSLEKLKLSWKLYALLRLMYLKYIPI